MKQRKTKKILFSRFLILITIFTLFSFYNSNTYATTLNSGTYECSTTVSGSTTVQNGYFFGGLSHGSLLRTRAKYDLSSLGSGTVTSATLNISVNYITNVSGNPTIEVVGSTQDDFSSYTTSLLPIESSLDSQLISTTGNYSFDVTSFVEQEFQNDQVVTLVLKGTSDIESNTANGSYDSSAGFNTASFSLDVTVTSASSDATLSNLVPNSGSLSPSFDSNTTSYTINVPYSTTTINFTPTANDSNYTSITVDGNNTTSGNASSNTSLSVGNNNIDVVVTAEDGSTQKTYSVTVNRAPLSTDATLSNLVPNYGSLSPTFSSSTTAYTINLPYSNTTINFTPTANDSNYTSITVDGNNTTSGFASSNTSLSVGDNVVDVVVTAEDGSTQKTYSVTVNRAPLSTDATLSNLVPNYGSLSPTFSSSTTAYTINLPYSNTTINFTPTANDSNYTSITVDGNNTTSGFASSNTSLSVGDNVVDVVVTAEDGSTQKTYSVTVNRAAASTDATLSNLVPNYGSLSPTFSSSTTAYTINVANGISAINFTPTANDSNYTSITVDGNNTTSGFASSNTSLSVGDNVVDVVVTAEDGSTQKTYSVTVNRAAPLSTDATLSNLVPNTGSLSPTFSSSTTSYNINVDNSISSINFTPTANDSNYTSITVDGNNTTSGNASSNISLSEGSNNLDIIVTAEDGSTQKTYSINVTRDYDLSLSNLLISEGSLTPTFDKDTTSYTVNVPYTTTSLTLTPSSNHPSSYTKINNVSCNYDQACDPINLNVGNNSITVVIYEYDIVYSNSNKKYASSNKDFDRYLKDESIYNENIFYNRIYNNLAFASPNSKTYNITVNRAAASTDATLSNLVPSTGSLSPTFSSSTTSYTMNVANSISSINFTPTANDSNYTSITVDSNNTTSGNSSSNINLVEGSNNVDIIVTAQDGTTQKTYNIEITRLSNDATLSNLTSSTGSLSPTFTSSTTSYSINVDNSISSINFTPTANDSNYTSITVDSNNTISGNSSSNINLVEGSNNVDIIVTAQDGTTNKTYSINVFREYDLSLSNLLISESSLTPTFDKNTTTYDVNVPYTTTSLTLTPSSNHPSSYTKINDVNCAYNQACDPINLDVGSNTITVVIYENLISFNNSNTKFASVNSSRGLDRYITDDKFNKELFVDKIYNSLAIAQNSKTYTINVTREQASSDATLSNLVPSTSSLSPNFSSEQINYSMNVSNSISTIRFTPTANDSNHKSIKVNSTVVTSESASDSISLSVGSNTVKVLVTAQNDTTKTYTITINRQSPPTPTPDPDPDEEEIEVDVVVDDEDDETDNETAAKVVIKRKEENGKIKDNIEFDENKADETVKKALETQNNKAIIQVKEVQGKEANESDFTLKKESVDKLSENNIDLTIESDNAKLDIPKDTLKNIETEDGKEDVSINIRKIDDPEEEKEVDEMIVSIVSGSKKIGVSVGISTNYSSLTKIFVPLKNVDIPTTKEEIDAFVAPLAVFIEHSDGENKIDKGEVAYDKDGNPIGINVWVNKFSNFSIIGLPENGDPDPLFSGQNNSFETQFIEDKSFEIEFNKPIKEESFNTDNIYIYDCFRNKIPLTIDIIKDDKIKITPETYFNKEECYYLYLTENLLAMDDTNLLTNTRYKFSVSSYELSGIKLKEYEDISLDKDWTISFNKKINKELIENCDIELFDEEENYKEFDIKLNDDYSIKITPKTNYKPGETYYLMINSAKLNDDTNIDDRTWIKFKTVDPSRTSKSFNDNNYIIR